MPDARLGLPDAQALVAAGGHHVRARIATSSERRSSTNATCSEMRCGAHGRGARRTGQGRVRASRGARGVLAMNQQPGAPGRAFTTPEMIELERKRWHMRAWSGTQPRRWPRTIGPRGRTQRSSTVSASDNAPRRAHRWRVAIRSGARRCRRRRQDDDARGRSGRRRARRVCGRRIRADLAGGPATGGGRHAVRHTATPSRPNRLRT